jgi:hypothetical protein
MSFCDEYLEVERMFENYICHMLCTIDERLGLVGDDRTRALVRKCIFEAWAEDQKEGNELLKDFSSCEVYLLNGDEDLLFEEWERTMCDPPFD